VIQVCERRRENRVAPIHKGVETPLDLDELCRGQFFPVTYMEVIGKDFSDEWSGIVVHCSPQLSQILICLGASVGGLLISFLMFVVLL
jgi:hypothetical protein